jgi:CRISPR-associated protein Csb2
LQTADLKKALAVPWEQAQKVAAWLRHQAAVVLQNEVDAQLIASYVLGHTDPTDKSHRLSYVPLPSIGGSSADGAIRRAMIVEPANMTGEVTNLLAIKLAGALLTGDGEDANCRLAPHESGDWTLRQYLPAKPERDWRSVTPVVLHGYNATARGVISVAKTERLLLRAFAMAEIREEQIERLAFQTGPLWRGAKHASAMHVPKHLDGYPRLHVQVSLKEGVRGPVLAGIGRHYGIGLFATA